MKSNKLILVTGGNGRFGKILKKKKYNNFIFPNKFQFDITKINLMKKFIKKKKIKTVIHLAGLSRPMEIHDKFPEKSIMLNIIGTSNLVIACKQFNVKLIYFSTSYVYPGTKGNYKENSPLLPFNNYAWSKLGGECAVKMYKNSLILRICMTEKPFIHKKALTDVKLNFIFQEKVADMLVKFLDKKGILNVGGPTQTVYEFAKRINPKIKKISSKQIKKIKFPKNCSMNLYNLKKIIN